jgi:hypothetical protein
MRWIMVIPTYEKVMQYFSGGTLLSPEILIEPLAIGFIKII